MRKINVKIGHEHITAWANRYGDDKTRLTLSEKAERICSETDPLNIYELDNAEWVDGCEAKYIVTGVIEKAFSNQDELNQYLEEYWDDLEDE